MTKNYQKNQVLKADFLFQNTRFLWPIHDKSYVENTIDFFQITYDFCSMHEEIYFKTL